MNRILLLISVLFIVSCTNKQQIPKAKFWKFAGGVHFGDALIFDEDFSIREDTIYKENQPLFILKEYNNQWYLGRKEIVLQDLETNELGYYIGK